MGKFIRILYGLSVSLLTLSGCVTDPGAEEAADIAVARTVIEGRPAARSSVTGKPRDVDPAVYRALPEVDVTFLIAIGSPAEGRRVFSLIGIRDERGELIIEHPPTDGRRSSLRDPVPMTITAWIGERGDPDREASLVRIVARQLETLAEQP